MEDLKKKHRKELKVADESTYNKTFFQNNKFKKTSTCFQLPTYQIYLRDKVFNKIEVLTSKKRFKRYLF
jgi:hypothetical protein